MKYKTSASYMRPGLLNALTAKIKDFNPNKQERPAQILNEKQFEAVFDALKSYRCQHTLDDDMCGIGLVDLLSPGETIKEGKEELEALAEHIACKLFSI